MINNNDFNKSMNSCEKALLEAYVGMVSDLEVKIGDELNNNNVLIKLKTTYLNDMKLFYDIPIKLNIVRKYYDNLGKFLINAL